MRPFAAFAIALVLGGCVLQPELTMPTRADWNAIDADAYTCTPAAAVDVTFDSLVANAAIYFGKCVRVRALYEHGGLRRDASHESLAVPVIGIYTHDELAWPQHAQFVVAIGRLRSCAARERQFEVLRDRTNEVYARQRKPNETAGFLIAMQGGPCHYTGGPALWVSEYTSLPTAMD